jgi:hypothetical protein
LGYLIFAFGIKRKSSPAMLDFSFSNKEKKIYFIGSTTNCVGKKFLPRLERKRTGEAITRIITNSINLKFELQEF